MTIVLDDTIRALTYCQFAKKADLMVGVREVEGKFLMDGRVRFYREDTGDPFKDKDRKTWFTGEYETLEAAIGKIIGTRNMLLTAAVAFGKDSPDDRHHVLIRQEGETYEEFFEKWQAFPFVHKKELKTEGGMQ